MTLDEILSDPQAAGQAYQDLRLGIVMADQQLSDVQNQRWTLNNLAAQWRAMAPQQQTNLLILAGIVAAVIVFK